jgi:hypothetical protein
MTTEAPPFRPMITLSHALTHPTLFGKVFAAPSFWTWRVVAKLIDGIPLSEPREIELFKACTGRTALLARHERRALRRFLLLCGRRAGKDRFLSAVAVWRASLCCDWRRHISAGEQAVVLLLGRDKKQAAILRRYCHGLLQAEAIKREVVRETRDVIEFRNGASLEIISNDASLVRGRSATAVLGSEACHWKHDETSASSDEEVVGAAEPSMAMCPDGGLLLLGSSVHRQRGYCYRKYKELHGNDQADDICWFAPSKVMNPRLPQSVVDAAVAEDPYRGGAEFGNRWREDLSEFVPLDAIESVTDYGIVERPPQPGGSYIAFMDASTGTGSDSFTLCIAHRLLFGEDIVTIDVLRERKPRFVPAEVIREYATLLKSYGVYEVRGDSFGGGLVSDEWLRHGITFKPSDYTTSENYLRALPIFLAKRCRLVDSAVLRQQLASLERHVTGTHEVVRHPHVASAHDDLATAVCGALVVAGNRLAFDQSYQWVDGVPIGCVETAEQRRVRQKEESDLWYAARLRGYLAAHGAFGWPPFP